MDDESLLEKEELRVGEVIAYYSSMFVAGDPRGRRESQVVRIRSDTTHEYPISLVSADILTKNTLIKRVKDVHGQGVDLPQGKWRKVYTFDMFPGKYRVENAHTILKAAMKNVIKDSYAAVYGSKSKENAAKQKMKSIPEKAKPKPNNISHFFMPTTKNSPKKIKTEEKEIEKAKEQSPNSLKTTLNTEPLKRSPEGKRENIRSSQNSTPQARPPPMLKKTTRKDLPDIEEALRLSTPKHIKREPSRDELEEKKAKKAKTTTIELPPPEADNFVIPKKSQQKANLSIETKELLPLPPAQTFKSPQAVAVVITPNKIGKPPKTNRPIDDTFFASPTGLKNPFASPSPQKRASPKTIRVNDFVKALEAEEKFEEETKSPAVKAPPKTPVSKHSAKWHQSRKHFRGQMDKQQQPTLIQYFGTKQ